MQVTKLKEDNEKLKIELDCEKQEKKYSSLREDEEEKNARDRIFNQRFFIKASYKILILLKWVK